MPLPLPTNGTVTMDSNTVGSVATYSCDIGFVINGPTSRMCEPGGSWSGYEPACEREFGCKTQQTNTEHFLTKYTQFAIAAYRTSCLLHLHYLYCNCHFQALA